ncbi:MAG: hypothetical protein R2698_11500 [Microthrixaceae bacterium]
MNHPDRVLDADRAAVIAEVESSLDELCAAALSIWEHPELCYEERFAHALLCDTLEGRGFTVQRAACGLDTAFVADLPAPDGEPTGAGPSSRSCASTTRCPRSATHVGTT